MKPTEAGRSAEIRPDRAADPAGPPGAGDPVPGERVGPYEVVRPIARGGMATVFEVRDVRDGQVRALKLLLPLEQATEANRRFRKEFRALSRLQHENVLQVFEWGLRGDRPWFSMELVPGESLDDAIDAWRDLDPTGRFLRVQAVLVQLARALAYVHDRGLVHRDVTPRNVMVRHDGVVKLMDFGVVKDLGQELTGVGEVIGTVAYIAPEQITGGAIDARADLYALGAVLYRMLTGKKPFTARTLQGYLEKHLNELPPPPHEVDPLVPAHLGAVCMRLLQKRPEDRFASAHHLLHVLGDIDPDDAEGRWPPRSVGRTLIRARMRDVLDDLVAGRSGAALMLTGPAGFGKSRLLDMAEAYCRRRGLACARGRCRPGDRPFGALLPVYKLLAGPSPPPVLKDALEGGDDGTVRERYPVMAALRDLLVGGAPVLVIVDDVERADPATLEAFEYLVRNTLGLAKERVAYLLAGDGENADEAARLLLAAGPLEAFEVGPFGESEVEELVVSVVSSGPEASALAKRLYAEGGGSPALIVDMLRAMRDNGLIVKDGRRSRLAISADEIERVTLPMPASVRASLEARLAPLSARALEVARTLAVGRRRVAVDVLVDACALGEAEVVAGLDELLEAGIAEEKRGEDVEHVDLVHHRLRDVLRDEMPEADRRGRHQRMGEILERAHRQNPAPVAEDLAWHFEQAGLAPKAYAWLQMAASRHLSRSLYESAIDYLDRALAIEPTARPAMLLADADRRLAEVYLERGRALWQLGRWEEGVEDLRHADTLARTVGDARLESRVAAEIGNHLRTRGAVDEAERALRHAIARAADAGDPALRPMPLYQLGALVWGNGDLAEAERLWKEALATAQKVNDERAMGFGWNGLGILALCRGEQVEARKHLEQSAELFERLGMLDALSIARVNLVELYLATGLLRKALALADRTVAQAREVHHTPAIAYGLAYRASVLLELRREEEALQNAREALRIVRRLGTADDEVLALTTLVRVDVARGDAKSAIDRLNDLLPLLGEHDSEGVLGQVRAFAAQALARLGRREEAEQQLRASEETGRQAWPLVQIRAEIARGAAWRLLGRADSARAALQRALALAEPSAFRLFQLHAHHELALVADDESDRARHQRVAVAHARSLAANLPVEDGKHFLSAGWGGVPA